MTAADLTLEEKAALTSGLDFWHLKGVDRLGVPSIMVTDGPHGLRKQATGGDHLGLGDSVPATCFPPAVALGSSWDVELVERVGRALGTETSIEDVAVVLGPGINIKRSVLCGRNFEYYSEDPVVSGTIGSALVNGVQAMGVGASLKHFAANNQEYDRMRASSDIDPRPLREIYLRGFERVVKDARPWTVMCSYNRINGVHASQDPWLLTQVLRDEWEFEGLVVSDWGAVADRTAALRAGLDLEMPSSNGRTDADLVAAVRDGSLDEGVLDVVADRVLDLIRRYQAGAGAASGPLDVDAHHALAREAAGKSIVLLRNEDRLLPLAPDADIAVVGAFAETPRFQGAGSSLINPTRVDTALDEIRALSDREVVYAPGFSLSAHATDAEIVSLRDQAVAIARDAETVVLFLGLPARLESEGFDRTGIDLPADQLELLDAVLAVNRRVVVVLSNGGVVALPFADRVPAIVEGWLLGQAGGGATADVLFGVVNPSGRLTETIPVRLADTPAYLDFGGDFSHVRYGEGLFVGYRWYDARGLEVTYPFGHGLSYTRFEYGPPTASPTPDGDVEIRVSVTNVGDVAGREVVQVYSSMTESKVQRAPRELKAFTCVPLEPGQSAEAVLTVRRDDLAHWDPRVDRWMVEGGAYTLEVGASSRDIRGNAQVRIDGDEVLLPLTRDSSIGEVLAHPVAGPVLQAALAEMTAGLGDVSSVFPDGFDLSSMLETFPIGRVLMFGGEGVTMDMIDGLLAVGNGSATP
ncbi:glycoside hydrolase family 3 C-terminal domain-containing protein [Gordonia neofelifaecis]|uniref:Exo-alpha-(1->6)-L-arabinopyranosidase n=1 Tax=Gordonia neofelifaecis NRRL B-59395 TaxID=644548 RepID=F1YHV4_9ACTN|nr:glycoside hydrolase family 3 C-terminal domain-containing protein [Gordonia neofelifaecis]EGD55508.1 beta-glucosidase [Gordonia neofelifaecis NRRL B-59395]